MVRDSFVYGRISNSILNVSDYAVIRKQLVARSKKRVLFFSHRNEIDLDRFCLKNNSVSVYSIMRNSSTEICPTNRTLNGTNSLYYKVVEASDNEIAEIFDCF